MKKISKDDWNEIINLAGKYVDENSEAVREQIISLLSAYRMKYGEHPAIISTLADYTEEGEIKISLLEKAYGLYMAQRDHNGAMSCSTSALEYFLELNSEEGIELWRKRILSLLDVCDDEFEIEEARILLNKDVQDRETGL